MNFAAVALLGAGLGVGQPAQPDYATMNKRELKLGISYTPEERKRIRQVALFASRDQGQTWTLESTVTPDKEFFPFVAKEDGVYWLNMQIVFTDGTKDPPDITRAPNPQKLLVDSTPPVVRVTVAQRAGDEIAVEWAVDDKYPNPGKTRLAYRPAGGSDADWRDVPLAGPDPRSARFNPGTATGMVVRVTAEDLAGNVQATTRDVPGATPAGAATAGGGPAAPVGGPIAPPSMDLVSPQVITPVAAPAPPPLPPAGPPAPVVDLTAAAPRGPAVPITPVAAPVQPPAAAPAPAPLAAPPGEFTPPAASPPPVPIAVGSGTLPAAGGIPAAGAPVAAASQPDLPPVHYINFTRFELPYQVEAGPSGVKQIDLYVTRDEGRTWARWSRHDGKESPLKVNLQARYDQRPDGRYGLLLVPVSGAGLSDEAPRPGTPPEARVHIDTIPPMIKLFRPEADPTNRNALVLIWSVTDENLGKDPVAIEWSDSPTGPWRSVVGSDSLVQVSGGPTAPAAPRIANTGRYTWSIPPNLPSHMVYLKVSAWDAAGNKSEAATQEPILVDLTKPRARIQGLQVAPPRP